MGRQTLLMKPPDSGAVIFYKSRSKKHSATPTKPSKSSVYRNNNKKSSDDTSTTAKEDTSSTSHTWTKTFPAVPVNTNDIPSSVKQPFGKKGSATAQAILRLAQDVSTLFQGVPYVKVVAGVVQQIITISNELDANKDRSQELVDKVMIYSRVVFEALLMSQEGDETQNISVLKEDLIQIGSVLESIYNLLHVPKAMSRLNRLIYRDDIGGEIAKQDRRLDTTIFAFLAKSSITLRITRHQPVENKVNLDLMSVRHSIISPRSKPQIMFGRHNEIDIVVNEVLKPPNYGDLPPRIPILGSGGIGKTTLALSVMHDDRVCTKFGDERVFVSCEAVTSTDFLIGELASSLQLPTDKIDSSLFQTVIRRLRRAPTLLVLDNFETPWDPPRTRSGIESLLEEITSIRTLVCIVTMRGSQKPSGTRWSNVLPPLQPVDLESALAIFKTISHKEDEYATKLIKAVDCVPLAVTLMANLASVDGETTEALWLRWNEESTSMVERGLDRLSSLEISVQVSLSSPRMQHDPSAAAFLSLLALLPDGMSPNTLHACITGMSNLISVKKAISTLRQNALVYEDSNGTLRILSPVRLFMRAHRPPSSQARQFLHDHIIHLALQGSSYHDSTVRTQLERESGNINAILIDMLKDTTARPLQEIIEAVVSFCQYTYISGVGSSEGIAMAVDRLQSLEQSHSIGVPLPMAENKISWRNGLRRLRFNTGKGQTIPTFVGGVHSPNVNPTLKLQADCLGCWGQVLTRQSRFELAREKFNLAKDLHLKAGDIIGQAYDMLNIGLVLSRDPKNFDEALLTFQESIKLHETANHVPGKAHGLLGAGHLFRDKLMYNEAQDMFNSAATLFSNLKDDFGRISALIGLGATMQTRSRFSEAETYFTEALGVSTEIGDVVSEAESLAGLAVTFLLRSRFAKAHNTIQKAISIREPFLDADHLHILGRVYVAKTDYEKAQKTFSLSQTLHEDSGDRPGRWDDWYCLALVDFYRGETSSAESIAAQHLLLPPALLQRAGILFLTAIISIRRSALKLAERLLLKADSIYSQVDCLLGQAACSHHVGVILLREGKFTLAMAKFAKACEIHTQIGNVQGQADAMNLICETLLVQGCLQEALATISEVLALHIQIEDFSGQGDDLYILSSIFLAQKRFPDAEKIIREALEMHIRSKSMYGEARDLARLGDILWQMREGKSDAEGERSDDVVSVQQAKTLFHGMGASGEAHACKEQEQLMSGKVIDRDDKIYRTEDDEYSWLVSNIEPLMKEPRRSQGRA
ncbi:hypothetical protein BYT27DRAFT_7197881 [Phlegmacium glaucopus]|nr:hypothetical protein BYT27DRAFT_7197881 [Phlegmacium glaucopus]